MIKEKDIVHYAGIYWVLNTGKTYTVYKTGETHSTADSAYPRTTDGLSLAIARCNYMAKYFNI